MNLKGSYCGRIEISQNSQEGLRKTMKNLVRIIRLPDDVCGLPSDDVSQNREREMIGSLVNNGLERMWKEPIMD
jgi:hypothetical protein